MTRTLASTKTRKACATRWPQNGKGTNTTGSSTRPEWKHGTAACRMRQTTPRPCCPSTPTTSGNSTWRPSPCIPSGASALSRRSPCSASTQTARTGPLDASSCKEGSPCSAAWSSGLHGDAGSGCTASSTPRPLPFARWRSGWPRSSGKYAPPPPVPCGSPSARSTCPAQARPSPP